MELYPKVPEKPDSLNDTGLWAPVSELETDASPELASALSSIGEGRLMSDESNLDLVSCAVAKVTHDRAEIRSVRFFMSKVEIILSGDR